MEESVKHLSLHWVEELDVLCKVKLLELLISKCLNVHGSQIQELCVGVVFIWDLDL